MYIKEAYLWQGKYALSVDKEPYGIRVLGWNVQIQNVGIK